MTQVASEVAPPLLPIFFADGAGGRPRSSGGARIELLGPADERAPGDKGEHENINALPRVRLGLRGDGKVYRTDLGERVNIDTAGRRHVVNEFGRRPRFIQTDKPPGTPSEEWKGIKRMLKDPQSRRKGSRGDSSGISLRVDGSRSYVRGKHRGVGAEVGRCRGERGRASLPHRGDNHR